MSIFKFWKSSEKPKPLKEEPPLSGLGNEAVNMDIMNKGAGAPSGVEEQKEKIEIKELPKVLPPSADSPEVNLPIATPGGEIENKAVDSGSRPSQEEAKDPLPLSLPSASMKNETGEVQDLKSIPGKDSVEMKEISNGDSNPDLTTSSSSAPEEIPPINLSMLNSNLNESPLMSPSFAQNSEKLRSECRDKYPHLFTPAESASEVNNNNNSCPNPSETAPIEVKSSQEIPSLPSIVIQEPEKTSGVEPNAPIVNPEQTTLSPNPVDAGSEVPTEVRGRSTSWSLFSSTFKNKKRSFSSSDPVKLTPEVAAEMFQRMELGTPMGFAEASRNWKSIMADTKMQTVVRMQCEAGIPPALRGAVWRLLSTSTSELCPFRSEANYADLSTQQSEFQDQIRRDLNRTFPKNILFRFSEVKKGLFRILNAAAVFLKDIGYCQGMGHVAAHLMMHMHEEEAFWTLVQLARSFDMQSFWRPELPGLAKSFFILEKLTDVHVPKIAKHFRKHRFSTSSYATQWFMTIFLYNFSYLSATIWDIFLLEGFSFLYAVGVAIFKHFQVKLLKFKFEELIFFLQFKAEQTPDSTVTATDLAEIIKIANSLKDKIKRSLPALETEFIANYKPGPDALVLEQ